MNGSATFDGCVFRDNLTSGDGAGVLVSLNGTGRVFRLDRCLIEGNTAGGRGGGIFRWSNVAGLARPSAIIWSMIEIGLTWRGASWATGWPCSVTSSVSPAFTRSR